MESDSARGINRLLRRLTLQSLMETAGQSGGKGFTGYIFMNELDLSAKIRVTLLKRHSEKFYGPGVQDLLSGIRVHGSVKDACEAMGMSYSKGRRILKHAESALGCKLVVRQQGGATGGSAFLTPEAEDFMRRYEELAVSVDEYARARLKEIFS